MSSEPRRRWRCTLWLAAVLGGCGAPSGPIFAPLDAPLRWPPAPETARLEYVGALTTDRDLRPRRSFLESVLGASPAQSMLTPYGVCTDGGDRLFVCDSNAQLVHVFDLDRRRYARWTSDDDRFPAFAQPLGVAWDPQGRLLVADAGAGCVLELDGEGRVSTAIGVGALVRPSSVAIDPDDGRIFVADPGAHAVVVFAPDGTERARIGERGVGDGQFNYPTQVAVGPDGTLYVADSLNFRVQVFDDALRFVRQVGSIGDRPGYFARPKGIAVDAASRLFVVDASFECVQIFDEAGQLLLSFGREGRGPGEFWLPAGIHVDSAGRIWVADSYNRRVQLFRMLGGAT